MVSLDELEYIIPQVIRYVYAINICTLAIGLIGNIIACIVMLSNKSFYTLTGFYLISLSIADIFILNTGVLDYIYLYKFEYMSPSKPANYVFEWIFQTSVFVSTLTVTVFTVERYLAICHPFFVQSIPKRSRVKKIIITIWIVSALLALITIVQTIIEFENEEFRQANEKIMEYLADIWATLYFFLPMAVIVVMYILIWLKLKNSSNGRQITYQTNRADTRTLIMFAVIVTVFFLSWAPYYVGRILCGHLVIAKLRQVTSDEDREILGDIFHLINLGKQGTYPFSSTLNPVIYSLMSKKFREAFKDLVIKSGNLVYWLFGLVACRIRSNAAKDVV